MTSGLALATAPAHAEPVAATPWQLGFDNHVATALSADGAFVYALGTDVDADGNETAYVLDTVSTADGAVTERVLPGIVPGRVDADNVETQVDTATVGADGTVFAGGYREVQDEYGNAQSVDGMLWTISGDSTAPTATVLDGFLEAETLTVAGDTLAIGGMDENRAPVFTARPATGSWAPAANAGAVSSQ